MCQACVQECPVLIGHVDLISDMRRYLVGEGKLSGPPARSLQQIGNQGNPYGKPNGERLAWAEGLDVPTVESNPDFEYLFWVGCAASFDPRAQKVARATAQLLKKGGVNFAVLGKEETCTGDPARRIGDEFLFQERATTNVETLGRRQVRKIVTACPHCHNTLQNEYPQFGGEYEVQHHSTLLAELIDGRPPNERGSGRRRTDHAARPVLPRPGQRHRRRAPRRPRRSRGTSLSTARCRAAGKKHSAAARVAAGCGSRSRRRSASPTSAPRKRSRPARKTLATGCPFCLNMMSDGMAGTEGGDNVKVLDIAEVLLSRQEPR